MKKALLRLLALLAFAAATIHAAEDKAIAGVRAADDERLAATKAADPRRLDAIFSDDLHYAHSSGKIDTKASYVKSLVSRNTVYESFDYKERNFKVAGPGVVLMSGRVLVNAVSNGQKVSNDLNILAVWREEGGKWRFLAWQSCKNPPADTAKK
ncbi:MAG: nuclear transport factor 2 family protein [Opitutaceae bacterium]